MGANSHGVKNISFYINLIEIKFESCKRTIHYKIVENLLFSQWVSRGCAREGPQARGGGAQIVRNGCPTCNASVAPSLLERR